MADRWQQKFTVGKIPAGTVRNVFAAPKNP